MQPIDYTSSATPPGYRCTGCGAIGVKLWRQSVMFVSDVKLRCVDCACKAALVDPQSVAEDGKRPDAHGSSDQLGELLPAVPTDDDSFWGYSAVPPAGVAWWKALPLRAPKPHEWTADRRMKLAAEKAHKIQQWLGRGGDPIRGRQESFDLAAEIQVLMAETDEHLEDNRRRMARGTTEDSE